jgi:hypothetical protein
MIHVLYENGLLKDTKIVDKQLKLNWHTGNRTDKNELLIYVHPIPGMPVQFRGMESALSDPETL